VVGLPRRLSLALIVPVSIVALLAPSSNALAATPVAGISDDGTCAHGLNTVAITTSCFANTTVVAVCVQPSNLRFTVTPTAKIGPKCDAYGGSSMGYLQIKLGGTFTPKDYGADNYDVTVTG